MDLALIQAAYIIAGLLFILSLAGLSKHETAKDGNVLGMIGMLLALVATLWLATAWWVLTDLGRRQANPAFAYLAAAGVVVATPLFFPLALAVYLILRPSLTLAEARQQRLAEMALALEEGCVCCDFDKPSTP